MRVWKTTGDGKVSVFTKDDVSIYKDHELLITCKGDPILIGKQDERGR